MWVLSEEHQHPDQGDEKRLVRRVERYVDENPVLVNYGTAGHFAVVREAETRLASPVERRGLRFAAATNDLASPNSDGVAFFDAMSSDAVAFVNRIFPFLLDDFAADFVMHSS
jgi:hypothetical protein